MPSEPRSPDLHPSGSDPASILARRQRWFYVGVYALIGGFFGPPLSMALNDFMQSLFSQLEQFSIPAFWAARTTFLVLFLMAVGKLICPRPEHFRAWKAWPPLLLAIPLGFWIFIVVAVVPRTVWSPEGMVPLFSWLNLAISTTGFAAVAIIRSHPSKPLADSAASEAVPKMSASRLTEISIEELRRWLREESPLEGGGQDMFSYEPRAKRLAKTLLVYRQEAASKLLQTTVIQGPLGIGKTSFIGLIKKEVQRKRADIIFVNIDCWGFSNLGAQEHVMEKIIEALGKHFDVLGMQQLPGAYSNALQESSGWIHGLLQMLDHQSNDPVKVLKCIEPVLEATNTFLVVVIEESDRNDHEFSPKKIEALLHRLRQVERVSFMLAATQKRFIDFAKVAEKVEPLPSLDPGLVATLLARMINEWGDPVKSGIMIPFRDDDGKNAWSEDVMNPSGGVRVLAVMIDTPRFLKHVLREVEDGWQILKGEVDLYDLVCVAVLKRCVEPIFDFIIRYYRGFHELPDYNDAEKSDRVAFLKLELATVMKDLEGDPGYIRVILERLLPASIVPDLEQEDFSKSLEAILSGKAPWPLYNKQKVKASGNEMYWQRLLCTHVEDEWPKDQDILRDLANLRQSDALERVSKFCVDSLTYRNFVDRFLHETILIDRGLARQFAAAVWKKAKPFRDPYSTNPASVFTWVQRWLSDSVDRIGNREGQTWYVEMLRSFLADDLDDALLIYRGSPFKLESDGQSSTLRDEMLKLLQEVWSPEGSYLSKRCRHGFDRALWNILREFFPEGTTEISLRKVPCWMRALILRDLREDPNRMALMVDSVLRNTKTTGSRFDLDKTKHLFGGRWKEALSAMADQISPGAGMDTKEIERLEILQTEARKALVSE